MAMPMAYIAGLMSGATHQCRVYSNLVKGYNGNRFLDNVWPQVWQCITVTATANSLGGRGTCD